MFLSFILKFFNNRYLNLLGTACIVIGCSSTQKDLEQKSAEEFYTQATQYMKNQEFISAAKNFDYIEQYHPYSRLAARSQIMSSYCYYKARAYERALEQLDGFIQLHPGHPDIAYAYYLKSYCFYHQISIVERDQKMTNLALEALNEIIQRYPTSSYAKDAKLKQQLTKDHLAGKDMDIGRFYQKQKLYTAAINRFKNVVDCYQETSHIAEALARLTECYLCLALFIEAKKTASVLGHNYPQTDWYADTYALMEQIDPQILQRTLKDMSAIKQNKKIILPKYAHPARSLNMDKQPDQGGTDTLPINAFAIAEAPPYEQHIVKEIKPDDASKTDIPATA